MIATMFMTMFVYTMTMFICSMTISVLYMTMFVYSMTMFVLHSTALVHASVDRHTSELQHRIVSGLVLQHAATKKRSDNSCMPLPI